MNTIEILNRLQLIFESNTTPGAVLDTIIELRKDGVNLCDVRTALNANDVKESMPGNVPNIDNTNKDPGNYRMPFGKHAGKTLNEIRIKYPQYYIWMLDNMTNKEICAKLQAMEAIDPDEFIPDNNDDDVPM